MEDLQEVSNRPEICKQRQCPHAWKNVLGDQPKLECPLIETGYTEEDLEAMDQREMLAECESITDILEYVIDSEDE